MRLSKRSVHRTWILKNDIKVIVNNTKYSKKAYHMYIDPDFIVNCLIKTRNFHALIVNQAIVTIYISI